MKKINPVSVWVSGQNLSATLLTLSIVGDNLIDSATFYYLLSTEDNQSVANGNLTMTPEEYAAWDESTNVNQAAYEWAAGKLNLTLVANQSY